MHPLLLAQAIIALAATAPAPAVQTWDPDRIVWTQDRPGGTRLALLEGDWATPGAVFTYAFYMPDGAWFPAHTHPSDARVVVLKGTLLLGEGRVADRAKARALPAGGVALVKAGAAHFEGARGETVIVGVATGPWGTTFLDR